MILSQNLTEEIAWKEPVRVGPRADHAGRCPPVQPSQVDGVDDRQRELGDGGRTDAPRRIGACVGSSTFFANSSADFGKSALGLSANRDH